jgi:hypothetical protein
MILYNGEEFHRLSEMPVWARLAFAQMIRDTYIQNDEPRHPSEAQVDGFVRREDTIWIYFRLVWTEYHSEIIRYLWPATKPKNAYTNWTGLPPVYPAVRI